jgi:hypothetical protein
MDLSTQVTAAAASAYAINLLQRWEKLPWITQHTKGITHAVRAIMALAASIGIGWHWDAVDHSLTITGLSLSAVIVFGWHWFSQFAVTHGFGQLLNGFTKTGQDQAAKP